MKLKIYQVDAFTDKLFHGNPAAICPLDHWLKDELMQKIANENNLSETGFYVNSNDNFKIRWFTPTVEVDLCGHATLAAAHVIYNHENYHNDKIEFNSRSGILSVTRDDHLLVLDFPPDDIERVEIPSELIDGFNLKPMETYKGKTDYMLVYASQHEIENILPDFGTIARVKARGIIVTAPGNEVDFVSRFFCPQSGINEDPVTGSAHTTLTPYWSHKLDKPELSAIQLSKRQGILKCRLAGERIEIIGQARTYLIGEIETA